ncbi:glycosyltransferase family 4 protein [Candidatus Woesearchaeota archaeon]|nr:glycosyltransferase family 4 protein [Candidatus Woesearchaeota archaeon]MBW2993985.1 glycosyltransferase family 4 protein [Candidatus Woesearchaeota archaeon]
MKPQLLITTDCFLPRWDGIARFLSELFPFLIKHFKVTVIAPRFPGKAPQFLGVKVIRMPLIPIKFGDIQFARVNSKIIKEEVEKADLIFNQTIGPIGMKAIKTAYRQKKPLISYVHNIEWELCAKAIKFPKRLIWQLIKRTARKHYNKCDCLIVPSKDVQSILTANKILTRKIVISLGVDTNKFKPAKSKEKAKKKIGINPKNTIIGFAGRIGREKDMPTLIKAFEGLQHKNLKLLIVGTGINLPNTKNMLKAGATNQVTKYLQAIDIFAHASLTETNSLSTMEAMACELPVVVTPVGSIKHYVKNNKNGLLFPRHNAEAMQKQLKKLVDSPKLRIELGKKARQTIIKEHNWKKSAEKITELLKNLTLKN